MHCFWCHNPEGRLPQPELQYYAEKCISCGECVDVCPNDAHVIQNNKHQFIRNRCKGIGECVNACYSDALHLLGKNMTVDEIMSDIMRDRMFYDTSNGGITLSGGEPVLYTDFLLKLLRRCKDEALHTTIQTCGNYNWNNLQILLPLVDLVMMDIKLMDPQKHKEATGYSNKRILDNAKRLALTDTPILFRTPIIPNITNTVSEITKIAKFIQSLVELRAKTYHSTRNTVTIQFELLPFHQFAANKYRSLGLDYKAQDLKAPTDQEMAMLADAAKSVGVDVINK